MRSRTTEYKCATIFLAMNEKIPSYQKYISTGMTLCSGKGGRIISANFRKGSDYQQS